MRGSTEELVRRARAPLERQGGVLRVRPLVPEWYAEDAMGEYANLEVYRTAIENAGYDSVIHDGDIFNMLHATPDTKHMMIFDPSSIRSVHAEFDPSEMASPNILRSRGGLVSKK